MATAIDPQGDQRTIYGPGGRRIGRFYLHKIRHAQPIEVYHVDCDYDQTRHPYIAAAVLELATIAAEAKAPSIKVQVPLDLHVMAFWDAIGFSLIATSQGPWVDHPGLGIYEAQLLQLLG